MREVGLSWLIFTFAKRRIALEHHSDAFKSIQDYKARMEKRSGSESLKRAQDPPQAAYLS